ncbi:HD domain-containing phosphohydrolase [Temperatibacter marinus]|uniref:HD domain-containing phosphohydrolase n=1 Tax=Temperatibacter marinus TaxID=1456591 RepID=A0AA52EG34_9PROT|nr:HD domain-containing phosphohydrolase [Temperatibacter marinus]WND04141.1 HD domain-containing phosphohydrolase [Temperatibacter marinus]
MSEQSKAISNPIGGLRGVFISLCLALVVGFYFIFSFANSQRDQDIDAWYDRLDLVAESRSVVLSAWLNRHLKEVEEISRNATLGLYAGEIAMAGESEQRGYTFNFLNAAAARSGFHEKTPLDQIAANINRPRRAGLGIFKADASALLQTSGMPMIEAEDWNAAAIQSFISVRVINKSPVLIIGAPIKVIDGMDSGGSPLWLIGARHLGEDFFSLLEQPGDFSQTAESYLVVAGNTDRQIRPLTPLKDGGRIGDNYDDRAAAFALKRPGARGQFPNYAEKDVLVTGRELSAPVDWILVRSITAEEALADINSRRNGLIITLSLAVFALLVVLVMVWRHGVSSRLEQAYGAQRLLTAENEKLSHFLQRVSDSQPAAVAAIDEDKKITFANEKLGDLVDLPASDLVGRRFETAFKAEEAAFFETSLMQAMRGKAQSQVVDLSTAESIMNMQVDTLPLSRDESDDQQALLVLQDITDLVTAQKTAEQNLQQLVKTLTQIIDARDPWSQYHSARVAEVAPVIMAEMGFDERAAETVRTAGQLMNLGKIFVPPEILTKTTPLDDSELALVRESMDKGADLLRGLEFGGPVEATLRQVREHWDGSGAPEGLSEDGILTEARVLAVANAFVGMVSSRAHRDGFSFDKALDFLLEDSGKKYQRRVVAALQNVIENKGGRQEWHHYGDRVKDL